jgi:hypothetical protein
MVGKEGAKVVSQQLGHADIVTTLRLYQTVFESDGCGLADLAGGLLGVQNVPGNGLKGR